MGCGKNSCRDSPLVRLGDGVFGRTPYQRAAASLQKQTQFIERKKKNVRCLGRNYLPICVEQPADRPPAHALCIDPKKTNKAEAAPSIRRSRLNILEFLRGDKVAQHADKRREQNTFCLKKFYVFKIASAVMPCYRYIQPSPGPSYSANAPHHFRHAATSPLVRFLHRGIIVVRPTRAPPSVKICRQRKVEHEKKEKKRKLKTEAYRAFCHFLCVSCIYIYSAAHASNRCRLGRLDGRSRWSPSCRGWPW